MIPYGKPYRAPTGIDPRAALISLLGGTLVAVAAGLLAWLWDRLDIPDFIFANLFSTTVFVQGLLLGLGLAQVYRFALLRSALVGAALAVAFAFLSVLVVQEARYIDYVWSQRDQALQILALHNASVDQRPPDNLRSPDDQRAAAADLAAHPFQFVNRNLRRSTGYDGLLGFIFELNRIGEEVGQRSDAQGPNIVKGQALWIIWGVNAAMLILLALLLGRPRLSAVYCADCRRWYEPPERPLKIPPGGVGYLAAAVKANDIHKLVNLQRVPQFDHELGSAEVALRACKGCGQYLAEVILRTPKGKHFKELPALKLTSVSPELAFAVKAGPELVPGAEVQKTPPWNIPAPGPTA